MILAICSAYHGAYTKTVGIYFNNWKDKFPKEIKTLFTNYKKEKPVNGEVYYRELSSIREFLANQDMSNINSIVILNGVLKGLEQDDLGTITVTPGLEKQLDDLIPDNVLLIGMNKCRKKAISRTLKFEQAWKYNTCFFNRGRCSLTPITIQWREKNNVDADLYTKVITNIADMRGRFKLPRLLRLLELETKRKT